MDPEEMNKILDEMKALTNKNASLVERFIHDTTELDRLDNKIDKAWDDLEKKDEQIRATGDSKEVSAETVRELSNELKELKNKAARSDADNDRIEKLKDELSEAKKDLETMDKLETELCRDSAHLRTQIANMSADRVKLANEIVALKETIEQNDMEFESLKDKTDVSKSDDTKADYKTVGLAERANIREKAERGTEDIAPLFKESEPNKHYISLGSKALKKIIKASTARLNKINADKNKIYQANIKTEGYENALQSLDKDSETVRNSISEMVKARSFMNNKIETLTATIRINQKHLKEVQAEIKGVKKVNARMNNYLELGKNEDPKYDKYRNRGTTTQYKTMLEFNKHRLSKLRNTENKLEHSIRDNKKTRDELKHGSR